MITMSFEDQEVKLPKDLTIDQWSQIIRWDFTDKSHWPRILSIATGVPTDILQQANEEGLELGVVFIGSILSQRTKVDHIDFSDMTFGVWVDLDIYVAQGIDKSIKDMMALLAPTVKSASEALYVIDAYNHFRSFILRQYKELFDYTEGQSDETLEPVDWQQTARSWYSIIVDLAGENLLNIDAITDEPLKKVLNFMALQKQKALEAQMRQRQQKKEYELQRNR